MNAVENNAASEPAEAVIISGPRKGEIIDLKYPFEDVSPHDLRIINEALDQLGAAIERLSEEFRQGTAAMKAGLQEG